MDKKLRELNLGTLVDRFHAEKIEPDNVISASDSELTRLGVSTIGALLNFDIENQNADLWGGGCERNPLHPPWLRACDIHATPILSLCNGIFTD